MSAFLKNCWYMAAWGHELKAGETLARKLVDIPVVLFRRSDGSPAALFNRCPHRFAPLSRGKVVGDGLQCGYHGLTFDGAGACTKNYFAGPIPPGAKVPAYPCVEQDNIIWFWPGDAEKADPAQIPSFPAHTDPVYDFIWGLSYVNGHFELVTDNLMDLSHVTFLHPVFGGELYQPDMRVEREGDQVSAIFFTPDAPNSPFGEISFPVGGRNVDELDIMCWNAPASMRLDCYRNFVGEDPKLGGHNPVAHILTPETETTTHYFWGSGMPLAANPDQEFHLAALTQAFEVEDKPMIGAVQIAMEGEDFWDLKPALLSVDKATVMVRRILRARLRQEQGAAEADAALQETTA